MDKALVDYMNGMLLRLEESFFHQTGEIAYTMQDLVGADFIQARNVKGETLEEILEACLKELVGAGIVEDVSFARSGLGQLLLTLTVKGCIHLGKEEKLAEDRVRPFVCPVANIFMDPVHEVLKWDTGKVHTSHPFAIDIANRECKVTCVVCEDHNNIHFS